MFLLDTNVLSELRRRERTDPQVAAWAERVDPSDLFLSAITILEIESGMLMVAAGIKGRVRCCVAGSKIGSCRRS